MFALKTALRARLTDALPDVPVFDTQAPSGTPYPLIVFVYAGGGDENRSALDTRNELWMVKTLADDHTTAHDLAEGIHAALHRQALSITGWGHLWTTHQDAVWQVENVSRRQIYHAGGVYRIRRYHNPS